MSSLKPGLNDLAFMIEKVVRDAIYDEVQELIERTVNEAAEKARQSAKSKVGSIAARVFSQVNFMQMENQLVIKVDTTGVV